MTKEVKKTEQPDYIGHRERLRKRFLSTEGKGMPDYELLELLLMYAQPRRDVKPLAKKLLKEFNSLNGILGVSKDVLLETEGVKEMTLTLLKLVKEIGVRMSWQKLEEKGDSVIANWDDMIDYCRTAMGHLTTEEFRIIFLNQKLKVIGEEIQQKGTVNQVSIHPREVMKSAINKGAVAIILAHNHPSGDVTPSKADIDITKQINEGAAVVGIKVIDHLIIGKNLIYSFKDHRLI